MKRRLGIALLLVAVLIVVVAIWRPWTALTGSDSASPSNLTVVRGVIGSEKKDFFDDQRVKDAFARHGLSVSVETAGSREIATTRDLTGLDFAFPSSAPAAQKLAEKTGVTASFSPFYSPMVVATWKPIADLLSRNGVMAQASDGSWTFDVHAYLALADKDVRWRDLDGAADLYNSPRSIMAGSTDIRTSNSAAMYMSILSYALNGDAVVTTDEQMSRIMPQLQHLFVGQGYSAASSDEPFKDYLAQGAGSKPLVVAYEAQYVGAQLNQADQMPADTVMAYLSPTVFSKHIVVPLTDAGSQVGELLATDEELQSLATEHGFRTEGSGFTDLIAERQLGGVQASIVDVADTPSYGVMERMITEIEKGYQ